VEQRLEPLQPLVRVRAEGKQIEVRVLTITGSAPLDFVKQQVPFGGRTRFKLVDDGNPAMREIADRFRRANPPGVTVVDETWTEKRTGVTHEDCYLAIADLDRLPQALAGMVPEDLLQADHEILLQRRATDWRTYYVFTTAVLDSRDIADARVTREGGRPSVAIELHEPAAKKLAVLSERSVGRKMVIAMDRRVMAVQIIEAKIADGRIHVAPGAGDEPDKLAEEAKSMVSALKNSPLPAPLELVREEKVTR
jgi:preprotein translocase subunit SecD